MNAAARRNDPVFRAERKGAGRVLLDLLAPGTTFRGFFEFTVIGAIVLAFLHGYDPDISGALRGWLPAGTPAAVQSGAGAGIAGTNRVAAVFRAQDELNQPRMPMTPHLAQVELRASYFSDQAEPLRTALMVAFGAFQKREFQRALDILANVEPGGKVRLLRGLALIGLADARNFQAGVDELERAIALGEPKAMAMLGVLKFVGFFGLPQDMPAGRRLLERAAAEGDAPAARIVGNGYSNGWAGAVDPQRAATYMRIAADRHDVKAIYLLAKMLSDGSGVAKDKAESERLMAIAADAGDADAEFAVGMSALRAVSAGATNDPEPALRWLNRAAAQGLVHASYTLGMFYLLSMPETGYYDPPRGMEYLRQCAEVLFAAECAFAYANAFELGGAGTRDPVKAYAFFLLADDASASDNAKQRLVGLAKLMTAEQIERAQSYSVEVRRQLAALARSRAVQATASTAAGAAR
jgi:TPR repeat protein